MSVSMCETIRERIPTHARGELSQAESSELQVHTEACADCRAEVDLARSLFMSRPVPPADLAARVQDAVRFDRRSVHRPWWGLTAAAVAALALGIGFAGDSSVTDVVVPEYAYEVENQGLWLSDDGLVAGAPSLEDLSDEALAQLLDELTVGSAGGAA
jgi:anti-sigma factor RsiW